MGWVLKLLAGIAIWLLALVKLLLMPFLCIVRGDQYRLYVALSEDQGWNVILAGSPDETISSRAHRTQGKSRCWKFVRNLVNRIFYWQEDHCLEAYLSEVKRNQYPSEFAGK